MALRLFENLNFGGVDSRSNPVNEPRDRFLRCLNWVPKEAGFLELRWGYTTVTMSTVSNATIQTLIPYTLWNGTNYVIFQQATTWKRMDANGTVTTPTVDGAAFTSSARSGWYNYNNHIHIGNGTDQKWYDGTKWRDSGLRAMTTGEANNVTVSQGSADANGLAVCGVGGAQPGYQFYGCVYNATTGHVGNRMKIGARLNFTNTASDVGFTGLPDWSGTNTEWKLLLGRTIDNGEVPYVCTDSAGNWLAVNNGSTSYTLTSGTIDGNSELPTRNTVIPAACTMFAVVGDYIYAADPSSPTIRRSGSKLASNQGYFVGLPEQSWAGNDVQTFPTAAPVTGIFEVDLELLAGTKNDCAVLTDMAGVPMWRGPWNVGIAGPRAGTKTHHGFYWVSYDKELCTFIDGLPTSVSDEYELGELSQLGSAYLSTVEVVYYRDKTRSIDIIRIEGQKSDGTPYTVIHDFRLRDQRSPYGQGYGSQFLGALGTIFVSSPVRDSNGALQVYSGATTGQLYKLYTGANDVGNEYTADGIMLVNAGEERVSVPWFDWYGDPNLQISIGETLKTSTSGVEYGFVPVTTLGQPGQAVQGEENDYRFRAKRTSTKATRPYIRLQLTSHSTDGDLTLSDPPHCPLEWYGRVYEIIPSAGSERGR